MFPNSARARRGVRGAEQLGRRARRVCVLALMALVRAVLVAASAGE